MHKCDNKTNRCSTPNPKFNYSFVIAVLVKKILRIKFKIALPSVTSGITLAGMREINSRSARIKIIRLITLSQKVFDLNKCIFLFD